jgi:DNA-binding protein H-NS
MPRVASLKVIERKIRELEAKAEAIKTAEKPGIKELRALMVKHRLSRSDVDLVFKKPNGSRSSALRGKPLKPKYRNPANKQETWAGRGLRPKWLVAAMKKGGKLEQFAI